MALLLAIIVAAILGYVAFIVVIALIGIHWLAVVAALLVFVAVLAEGPWSWRGRYRRGAV
jgi:drug/metabolite transporter (DMT)-like permease